MNTAKHYVGFVYGTAHTVMPFQTVHCVDLNIIEYGWKFIELYLLPRLGGTFDLRLAVSVPLPIVTGIFVLLWFQSRLT